MTYGTVADMVESASLIRREHAAIAKEGIDPPEQWQWQHRWKLASQPGWDAAWDSALAGHPDDGDPLTPEYDPGDDPGVITDGMILAAIQGLIEAEKPPILVPPGSVNFFAVDTPHVTADPQTIWGPDEYATFTDGAYRWTGSIWVLHVIITP